MPLGLQMVSPSRTIFHDPQWLLKLIGVYSEPCCESWTITCNVYTLYVHHSKSFSSHIFILKQCHPAFPCSRHGCFASLSWSDTVACRDYWSLAWDIIIGSGSHIAGNIHQRWCKSPNQLSHGLSGTTVAVHVDQPPSNTQGGKARTQKRDKDMWTTFWCNGDWQWPVCQVVIREVLQSWS